MKKHIILLSAMLMLGSPQLMMAQNSSTKVEPASRWYVGGGAGVSFGSSTFQSVGADKTRVGWGLGVLGGYRINSFLSTEASLDYTRLDMGSYYCCNKLWLDNTGNRHTATGNGYYSYKDIYSGVNLFQLGLHLNVDVLKIFKPESRWSVLLSPAIYGLGSMAKIQTKEGDTQVYKGDAKAHFGAGGDLGVGYQVSDKVNVRLFGGLNYITGNAIDAMPRVEHSSNYVWNTGVKVIFSLNKKNKTKKVKAAPVVQSYEPVEEVVVETAAPVEEKLEVAVVAPVAPIAPVEPIAVKEAPVTKASAVEETVIYKTTVYYDTGSANVKKKFYYPIAIFLNKAKANPNAKIILEGWADKTGTDNINGRISSLRAEVLQKYFISQKISADRISNRGNGVDSETPNNDDARRVDILLVVPN